VRDALGLLTTLGRRGGRLNARAFAWFPVVGAAIGALVGTAWWLGNKWWTPSVAAAVAVVVDLGVTGMLHFDGLADSADGLLPHATRDRRLDIMRAPDIGAFGAIAIGAALILRTVTLASIGPSILLLAAIWAAGRALVASVPAFVDYARDDGIASSMIDGAPRWPVLAVPIAAACAWLAVGWLGAVAVVVGALAGTAVVWLARHRLGGFTGDVLGAAIVVTETVALLVAAGRS
jgi:adenosylcobinamide-GDP ribazoletransferase